MSTRLNVTLVFCALLTCSTAAHASDLNTLTHEYTLNNGLKILVREDHRAPIVISELWYKVGASYEPNGITGVSHALEHLMFRGTTQVPDGEFSKLIAKNGGTENAMTSSDYTMYYEQLPAEKLELALKLEADRMENLALDASIYNKEIEVVKEERRLRTDDNPQALTYERLMAAAHLSNPYHHPVIGWMNDLQNMTLTDLKDWYHQWYTPNNAVLVVAGDVTPEHVITLAKRYFGTIEKRVRQLSKPRQSVQALGERTVEVQRPAKLPWMIMAFNTPVLRTAKEVNDVYALSVAAAILSSGDSARLPTRLLRKKQIVSDIAAGYTPYRLHNGTFTINATPAQGHTLDEIKDAVFQEIKNLQTIPVNKNELTRITTQLNAQKIYKRDGLFSQATELGHLLALGLPWQESDHFLEAIKKITPADLQRVSKKYLVKERLTTARLRPTSLKPEKGSHHE